MGLRAMVVEDDNFTRLSLVAALEQRGITVALQTASGAEAVTASKKNTDICCPARPAPWPWTHGN